MPNIINAIILGLVEGITEFLPVSSTGHLILASSIMGFDASAIATFEIGIQLGAILAVVILYRKRFMDLIPFVNITSSKKKRFSGFYGLWLLFLTCLPAGLIGLTAHDYIKKYLFSPTSVAVALAVGAIFMLLIEKFAPKSRLHSLDEMTPRLSLGIGICQCLSLWPGFSRSASTIMGGMLLKTDRKLAADYSFIAAVPLMFAATGYELYKNMNSLAGTDLIFFAIGFITAFLSAWAAVKIFISIVSRVTLRPFAYYRLILAALVYIVFVF